MTVIFACRRYRLRDVGLIRLGALAAGHRFWILPLPRALPLLVLVGLARWLLLRKVHLVISDKMLGDTLLARLFGRHCTRMLWNYADEWPASGTRLPRDRVCFFDEPGQPAERFVFAPQPARAPTPGNSSERRQIVFVGDVTEDASLPNGAQWWRARFEALRDNYGYGFYLTAEYESLITRELGLAEQRLARVFAKNLLRLWIIQAVHARYDQQLVLLGSNWRRFGMNAIGSVHTQSGRLDYYRSAVINLDCASKSGDSALYPRSSELISYAGGILQVRCSDSERVFGGRVADFCFDDLASLVQRIDARLAETPTERADRDRWLVQHLSDQQLLMQHSVDRMLGRRDAGR